MKPVGRDLIVMLAPHPEAPGGVSAVVRSYREGGLLERWPVRLIPTYRYDRTVDKIAVALRALASFCGLAARRRVAVVHAHSAARASFWRKSVFLVIGRLVGARTILHLHSGLFPAYYETACGPIRKWLVRRILRSVDVVVVLTPSWVPRLRAIEPRCSLEVISNAIATPSRSANPEACTVLFLGRLRAEKGLMDLLAAVKRLVGEFPGLRVVCAGDGDVPALMRWTADAGLDANVEFPGWVEGAHKEELLARATVFVLPSYFEGLPVGVLEAMAQGVPVVATRVGGIPDALGDDAGVLIEPGDVEALTQALRILLGDAARRSRMGAAGARRAAEYFGLPGMLNAIGDLYERLGVREASWNRSTP